MATFVAEPTPAQVAGGGQVVVEAVPQARLEEVRGLLEQSLNDQNFARLEPQVTDNFAAVLASQAEFGDLAAFGEYWQEGGMVDSGERPHVKLTQTSCHMQSDYAVCGGTAELTFPSLGSESPAIISRWTAIYHRVEGVWKLSALHLPLSSELELPTPPTSFGSLVLWALLGAGLGLLFGVACMMVILMLQKNTAPKSGKRQAVGATDA